ncbi:MAG: hypothetical protein ACE5QF_00405 [Thermoplasmata archaeon]
MRSMEDLFENVRDLLSYEEFCMKVSERMDKFGGLLTEDAAALLVAEELGRFNVNYDRIADIRGNQAVRLKAEVLSVSDVKEFRRRNESIGRVANITISDGSAKCRLVLWDDDTQLVSKGAISVGGSLRVINGYSKMTDFGLEISKGRYGAIIVE